MPGSRRCTLLALAKYSINNKTYRFWMQTTQGALILHFMQKKMHSPKNRRIQCKHSLIYVIITANNTGYYAYISNPLFILLRLTAKKCIFAKNIYCTSCKQHYICREPREQIAESLSLSLFLSVRLSFIVVVAFWICVYAIALASRHN